MSTGPLAGYRIIELAGIGPGPFAAMMLADLGADVIRVERAQVASWAASGDARADLMSRGRRNVAIDLKHPDGVGALLDLVERADALDRRFPARRDGTARRSAPTSASPATASSCTDG